MKVSTILKFWGNTFVLDNVACVEAGATLLAVINSIITITLLRMEKVLIAFMTEKKVLPALLMLPEKNYFFWKIPEMKKYYSIKYSPAKRINQKDFLQP